MEMRDKLQTEKFKQIVIEHVDKQSKMSMVEMKRLIKGLQNQVLDKNALEPIKKALKKMAKKDGSPIKKVGFVDLDEINDRVDTDEELDDE